jgi:hypothetical protein
MASTETASEELDQLAADQQRQARKLRMVAGARGPP